MNRAKRLVSLLLAIILVVSACPVSVFANDSTTEDTETVFAVDPAWGMPGSLVQVNVCVDNNPGILGATLSLAYDEKLTLTDAVAGEAFAALEMTKPGQYVSGCSFVWDAQDVDADQIKDGIILTLTFKIADDADINDKLDVIISAAADDIFDTNFEDVPFSVLSGNVQVIDYKPGDLNSDGVVNQKDTVLLRRAIVGGYDQTIKEAAADVNNDGKLNAKDTVMLRRFIVGGYDVILLPSFPQCTHALVEHPYKAATCTEDGNLAYWQCTACGKYYNSAAATTELTQEQTILKATGHTEVAIPGSSGTKCSKCGETLTAPDMITVNYVLSGKEADAYLENYLENLDQPILPDSEQIDVSASRHVLPEFKTSPIPGYTFVGWFNIAGEQLTYIEKGQTEDVTVYAKWTKNVYDVNYKLYRTPVSDVIEEKYKSYTVDKGLVDMPNPEIHNYVFLGWYTDDGKEVTEIPAGTTGHITLNAHWTSRRNLAKAVKQLEDPILVENTKDGVIYFAYELGTIENVPLSDDFWTIYSVAGLDQQRSETVEVEISEELAKSISDTIANTTVDSATWTTSKEWNDVLQVSEEWAKEQGMDLETATEKVKTESGTYSVTDSNGGANTTSTTDGTTAVTYDSKNYTHGNSAEFNAKIGGKYSTEASASASANYGVASGEVKVSSKVEISGELSGGYEQHKDTNEHSGTDTTEVDTTVTDETSTWNHDETRTETTAASESESVRQALSQVISSTKGYGKSYATGGQESSDQGFSSTNSTSSNSSSSVTYFKAEKKITTTTYSTNGMMEGAYRSVLAGTAHVFGVVGYDVGSKSFFTYTFSVMDDEVKEFLDYSRDGSFTDDEYSVLPFEIPYEVYEYVTSKTVTTQGLGYTVDSAAGTARITQYTGTDTDVIIPSYISANGTGYKVTGLDADVFAGNTTLEAVILSDHIETIPAGAFKGCTGLKQVSGYFTEIGDEAFSGCTALETLAVGPTVTLIGTEAFKDVPSVKVTALNAENAMAKAKADNPNDDEATQTAYAKQLTQKLVNAAVVAGAKNLTLDISNIIGGTVLTVDVPNTVGTFELLGGGKTFTDLKLTSAAETTVLRKLTVKNCTRIPLEISSKNLTMEVVTVESPGYALLLSNPAPAIRLERDSRLVSANGDAMVCKTPNVTFASIDSVTGTLTVSGNVYVYGTADEIAALKQMKYFVVQNGEIKQLTDTEYEQYIKGALNVNFDADGGTVSETSRVVFSGAAIGTLPTPTRTGYKFEGWYDGETLVTADSTFSAGNDVTLKAKWTVNQYNATWKTATGVTITVKRTSSPNAGAELTTLASGDEIFYGDVLSVTYKAKTGFTLATKGKTSITVTKNVTSDDIYATATANAYTVEWSAGTGTTITVKRTSSPYGGAATGTLTNKATIYYGDVLSITYAAKTGYTLATKGKTSITVSGNVTSSDIYATATVNSYTATWSVPRGATITVKRTSSPNKGAATGTLSSGATVYYGDVLSVTYAAKSGYTLATKGSTSITVKGNVTSSNIYMTVNPTPVSSTTKSGTIYTESGSSMLYSAVIEHQNRTADSVQIRVTWTATLNNGYNSMAQWFRASVGSVSTGNIRVVAQGAWSSQASSRSATASSGWITVPLSTTNATSVNLDVYYYQANYNGTDLTPSGYSHLSTTWSIALPAY